MIKKYAVYISVLVLILPLFSCSARHAPAAASDVINTSQTACVTKPQKPASSVTDVSPAGENGYFTCVHNGVERKFILYIPEGVKENAPLVFMLHGFTGNSKDFMEYTEMNGAAKRRGYAVVYPQGLYGTVYNTDSTCWNADLDFTDTDDIGFLVALAEYLQQEYGFSSSQTFAAGHSNGGFMCYKLACGAHDTFRAIASVSGTMSGNTWKTRDDSISMPILQIHGTADNVVPMDGSMSTGGGWGGAPALCEIIEYWKDANGLDEHQEVRLSDRAAAFRYSGKGNDNLIWYVEIEGFGHEWPREENAGFSASEVILEFFSHFVG